MFWTDSWKVGAAMVANGLAWSETAVASQSVIGHRTRTIDAAMRDPMSADLAELGRMVPEKLAAFEKSGQALVKDWVDIQSDMMAQASDLTRMMLSGRPPSMAALERVTNRGTHLAVKMSAAVGHALAPVHAAATANQRRLDARRP